MAYRVGLDAVVYRLTEGTREAWADVDTDHLSELDDVQEPSITLERGEAELTRRGSAWALTLVALKRATIEITMVEDPEDANFEALRDAWVNGTSVALAVLDEDMDDSDVTGLWADFVVTSMAPGQPLEEVQTVAFTVKPTHTGATHLDPEFVGACS